MFPPLGIRSEETIAVLFRPLVSIFRPYEYDHECHLIISFIDVLFVRFYLFPFFLFPPFFQLILLLFARNKL